MSPGLRRLKVLLRPLGRLLETHRRVVSGVTAALFVPAVVLLSLDTVIPFPRPDERPLYDPRGWSLMASRAVLPQASRSVPRPSAVPGLGGGSASPPPLATMVWTVGPGETITGIAEKLGMNADTISSLNRPGGRGVHTVVAGERIRIPNQDGIFVTVNRNLDALCGKYGVDAEEVLAVNGKTPGDLAKPTTVFLPGVQFTGYEHQVALGTAVLNPLPRGWLSSPFGRREDPFAPGQMSHHQGIDIAAPAGSSVLSASDGRVATVSYNDVLGNYAIIRDPIGRSFVYGHMQKVVVRVGEHIGQRDRIGYVGATGHATGPHLHFEVRDERGVPVNPRQFMPGP
jgi:murein DD-endopeptidase MepM/ murein hydrolase activator NlpD